MAQQKQEKERQVYSFEIELHIEKYLDKQSL